MNKSSIADLKTIKSIAYKKADVVKGYTDKFLSINLDSNDIVIKSFEQKIKDKFIGGKGYALWMLFNCVKGDTKWNDPENAVCIASGPLGGSIGYPGAGKSIAASISPLTRTVIDSNVGGYFGPYKKFSGFDALKIFGKAKESVVIFIDGIKETIEILKAKNLPEDSYALCDNLTKYFDDEKPLNVSVVSTGQGAKNSFFGCLNFTWWDARRKIVRYKQAGRGGIGTVLADKNVKALVVRCGSINTRSNNPDNLEALNFVRKSYSKEINELDLKQNRMSVVGTTHLVPIMNDHDCLPVHNFKFGSHPQAISIGEQIYENIFDKGFDGCWQGCAVACAHGVKDFFPLTGPYKGKKVFVDGPEYETIAGCGSNLGIFDAHTIIEINFYCDAYGIDTISTGTSIGFAMECFENNLITIKDTKGIDLSFGNRESVLKLIHQMALGQGFGVIIGMGVRKMKEIFAKKFNADPVFMKDIGMESKGLEFSEYISKESLAQQGGYGIALKGPQHDEAWLIFLDMVHNFMPSFENKAEALHWFPMFRTWFSLCGLCKLPWNDIVPFDNKETKEPAKVMKHVNWYADFFNAITGKNTNAKDLIAMSEAVYNFQRVFNLKMGFGTKEYDTIPYRAMGPVTMQEYESRQDRYDEQLKTKHDIDISKMDTKEKMAVLRQKREEQYEMLKYAVYKRRGWDENGIPLMETIKKLGIDLPEVVNVLQKNRI